MLKGDVQTIDKKQALYHFPKTLTRLKQLPILTGNCSSFCPSVIAVVICSHTTNYTLSTKDTSC